MNTATSRADFATDDLVRNLIHLQDDAKTFVSGNKGATAVNDLSKMRNLLSSLIWGNIQQTRRQVLDRAERMIDWHDRNKFARAAHLGLLSQARSVPLMIDYAFDCLINDRRDWPQWLRAELSMFEDQWEHLLHVFSKSNN